MQKILYTSPDGVVHMVTPAPQNQGAEESYDAFMIRVRDRSVPADAVDVVIVEEATIPTDREFRDGWEQTAGVVSVNMPKARDIHMDKIRLARNEELNTKDIAWNKADTAGRSVIDTERQTLRDIPATFDLSEATTPDELKALWPSQVPK
jgi:hypothetical protein